MRRMPPKVRIRRPAAAGAGLRRPAAREEAAPAVREKKCSDLRLGDLESLGRVLLRDAVYYGRKVNLAGRFLNLGMEEGQPMGVFEVSGTQDEGLLRSVTGRLDRRISVHLCADDCGNLLTDEFLVHGKTLEEVEPGAVAWHTNMVSVDAARGAPDELAIIREDEDRRRREVERGGDRTPKEKQKDSKTERKAKKKQEAAELKKKRRSESEEEWEVGQKPPRLLFEKTGLDPDAKERRKILRKARKTGRSKKE